MNIIETTFNWKDVFVPLSKVDYIVLHHRAGDGDVDSIHQIHLKNGWTGIGYHFYVRKDGSIYRGRPITAQGAHCVGSNNKSIGVCFEGNYEINAVMPNVQKKAGQELVGYLKSLYPSAKVKRHSELASSACPGKHFPFDEIQKDVVKTKKELTSANDITWELSRMIEINDVDGFVKALDKARVDGSPLYWGFRKIVNKQR